MAQVYTQKPLNSLDNMIWVVPPKYPVWHLLTWLSEFQDLPTKKLALVACTKVARGDKLSDTWNGLRGEVRPMDTGPFAGSKIYKYTVYSIHAT